MTGTERTSGLAGAARSAAARLPAGPGVYRFRDGRGRALYVGRAVHLRRRAVSYWSDLGGRGHLRPMVERIARVEALPCDSEHEAAWLERNLLERRLPPWNRTAGGAEVPAYIRVDARAGSAGASMVHQPVQAGLDGVRHFGPYLGGLKVRTALAALHRVLPLAYAGGRLSGAEREMARVRGVAAGGREELAQRIAAVLCREPAAVASVRAELVAGRDRAAERLDYERAGRLRDELDALDWVVAPQRVTVPAEVDLDVCGWAGGVLVRLEVRGGRLCGWSQRACGERGARAAVAGTPPEWAGFAERAARLAAALAEGAN